MPIGKRQQSNAMLYTLIAFVGLFVVTTALAVIFYLKTEEHKSKVATLQAQTDELATSAELRKIGALIGEKQRQKSRLGTMVDYLDQMVYLIIGGLPEDTSAEVKVDQAKLKTKETLQLVAAKYPDVPAADPNLDQTAGLIRLAEELKTKLDHVSSAELALQQQYDDLQNRFDDAMAAGAEKEKTIATEKEKYKQQVDETQKNYNELKTLMQQTTEQQVQSLLTQLEQEKTSGKELNQQLLKTQAELQIAENRIKLTQEKLQSIVPPPDTEMAAFKPDGEIILIDNSAKIVHINLGSDDRIYRGLTFSVYEKNLPIPKDGTGKAEIEVFNVRKAISAARIIRSEIKRPIVLDDVVANLIWDSDKTNIFVVAGEFDLDGDGNLDYDAVDRLKALIEKWGGRADQDVCIETDFIVLGNTPEVLRKPTFEQMEVDPMAMQKYEDSLQKLAHYKEIQERAQTFSIPVFNAERFLYFIGYKTQATRAGAF